MENTVLILKALSDETRLRILNLIREDELCICQIQAVLKMSQPRISRHVRILKEAGVITYRQDAQRMFLSLSKAHLNILKPILESLSRENLFIKDQRKISEKITCA